MFQKLIRWFMYLMYVSIDGGCIYLCIFMIMNTNSYSNVCKSKCEEYVDIANTFNIDTFEYINCSHIQFNSIPDICITMAGNKCRNRNSRCEFHENGIASKYNGISFDTCRSGFECSSDLNYLSEIEIVFVILYAVDLFFIIIDPQYEKNFGFMISLLCWAISIVFMYFLSILFLITLFNDLSTSNIAIFISFLVALLFQPLILRIIKFTFTVSVLPY
jgi:hypothetical protein